MGTHRLLLSALLFACMALPGSANVLGTYTDRTAWKTAINDPLQFTNITYETATAGDYSPTGLVDFVINGLSFFGSSTNPGYLVVDDTSCAVNCGTPSGNILRESQGNAWIDVVLPSNVRGFGIDLLALASSSGAFFDISFTSGTTYTYSSLLVQRNPSTTFWGVNTDSPITGLRISNTFNAFGQIAMDNFEVYQLADMPSSETPEVGTLLLIGTGLVSMRWMKRRRLPKGTALLTAAA